MLDISMPGMDGWQLLTELRTRGIDAPVIVLSADPYEDARQYRKKADFQAYINKPLRLEKLLEQLQRCLDLHWRNTEPASDSSENIDNEESLPDQESITVLRDFAKIGYLKGVLECTEQLESKNPRARWVNRLRSLADNCDLDGIVRTIDEWDRPKSRAE